VQGKRLGCRAHLTKSIQVVLRSLYRIAVARSLHGAARNFRRSRRYFTSTQRNGDHARKGVLIAITMTGRTTNAPSTGGLKVQITRCSTPRTTC
jgi:hypothetical protein